MDLLDLPSWTFTGYRFAYVDVTIGSVLKRSLEQGIVQNVHSYDSACGWTKNFLKRLSGYDPVLITPAEFEALGLKALIPKFHLGRHKPECSDTYSFNYTKDVGWMSGEAVETPWATFNWLQYALREMGWGNRRDLLTEHFLGWNWWKIIRMGELTILLN